MSKVSIEVKRSRGTTEDRDSLKLTPRDMRSLYFLREPYMDKIVDAAAMLDEHDRKLAARMLQTLIEHRRSSLS